MRSYVIAIITGCLFCANAFASDSDNDKVLDTFDLNPSSKVKPFAKGFIQINELGGNFNNVIEKGRYRFGDAITLIGNNFSALSDPVVVVYQHNNVFNFKPSSVSANQLTFNFDVPKGKYALFVYDADSKTNEMKVDAFNNASPLIFGHSEISLTKGKPFTLNGVGFTKDSKIVIGALKVTPSNITSTQIQFDVPNNAAGLQLYVENASSKSNIVRIVSY